MASHYHLNTEKFSLRKFKTSLASRKMIPSRVSLKDDLDVRFSLLEKAGISNLKELIAALKSKAKIELFSSKTGLSIKYLTLLKREASSYLPNPVRLDKFADFETGHTQQLESEGISNSRHLFEHAYRKSDRMKLSESTQIPISILDELVCLSDLVRVYGVGPVFARMIHDVGIRTVEEFVQKTPEEFIRIYEEKEQKKADFGVDEIGFALEHARDLDIIVELEV